ncbi:MAG: hypothetical protein ACYDCL_08300 [Myxococcales bacterium]
MLAALVLALTFGNGTAARDLAKRSMVEYDAGDFDKALADAQQAYELTPLPGLLFNLGQCHRALHHWERAEFFYRGYLRKKPDAKNRAEVEALIAQMQGKQREAAAPAPSAPILVEASTPTLTPTLAPTLAPTLTPTLTPTPTSTPIPAPQAAVTAPPPRRPVPAGAWVTGAVGVAAIAAGAVFAVLATNLRNQDTPQPSSGTWFHRLDAGSFGAERTDAYLANGLIYGGIAVLAGGVLWGVLGRGSPPPSPAPTP